MFGYLRDELADMRTAVTLAITERNVRHLRYALPTPIFRLTR